MTTRHGNEIMGPFGSASPRAGGWALALLLTGLIVTALVASHEKAEAEERATFAFDSDWGEIKARIEDRIDDYEQLVRSGAAFFAGSDRVTRQEWRDFVGREKASTKLPGIQGFGFALLIPRQRLIEHTREVRAEGFAGYRVWPEGEREPYTAVVFLEPISGRNLHAFGYDMFSEPVRRAAMERARDQDAAALTGKVRLVQEIGQDDQAGVLLFIPVYRRGVPHDTAEERRTALAGWVYSSHRMNDLIQGILGGWKPEVQRRVRVEMFDRAALAPGDLLYDSGNRGPAVAASDRLTRQASIEWGGHRWFLRFSKNGGALGAADYEKFWVVLGSGVVMSVLLAGLVFSLASTRVNAQMLARRLTEDLRRSEERWKFAVEGPGDGVWDWDVPTNEVMYSKRWKEMLGYAGDETGPNLGEWRERVHPDDRAQVIASVEAHHAGRTAAYSSEHRVRSKDGSWKWILDRGLVVSRDPAGKPLRVIGTYTDISARKQVELVLLRNESRMRRAEQVASFGHWEINLTTQEVVASASARRICGLGEGRLSRGDIHALPLPEYRATRDAAIRHLVEAGGPYNVEFRLRRANDGRFVDVHSIAEYDPATQTVFGVVHDITERRRAEADLRKLSSTVEQAPTSIVITDLTGAIEYVNPCFTQVSGYTFEEVRGQNPRMLKSNLTPPETYRDLWQTLTGGRVWRGELYNKKKNGEIFAELVVIAPIVGPEGRITHYGAIKVDITTQKRAEEGLREREEYFHGVFDASPIPILLTSLPDGRILEVNTTALTTFGVSREDVIGKSSVELDIWSRAEQRDEFVRRVVAEKLVKGFEVTIRTRFGTELIMLCTGALLTIGGRVCVLTSAVDITAVRRAEADQAKLQERIYRSQKFEALGTLAGGIAHDFNNILTGIINYTALAQADCPPGHPRIAEFLGEVLKGGNRAKELVRQILLFSRAEEAEQGPVMLQRVVEEALSFLRSTLPAIVEVKSDLDPRAPVILANATQIHQAVINLCINAAHAMQERGGILTVKVRQQRVDATLAAELSELKPGLHVCLEVSDTGTGMEPAVLARIFEPFFTTKNRSEGTGLGLAVVHGVVRSHEGAIRVRTQPGVGTTFEVFLPVLAAGPASARPEESELPRGRGQRIMLVDDEVTVATSMQILLERMGYKVTPFTKPELALARFWTSPNDFDMLITDFQMPGMTGVALAKKVLAHRPTLPVCVMTGFSSEMTGEKMRAEGVTELIQKPIDMRKLSDALARAFD